MKSKVLVGSVLGGVLVTLLSGLFPNTPEMLVGAEHFGFPLPWLIRIVYPGSPLAVPPEYYGNLVVDIVIWTIVVGIVLFIVTRRKTK